MFVIRGIIRLALYVCDSLEDIAMLLYLRIIKTQMHWNLFGATAQNLIQNILIVRYYFDSICLLIHLTKQRRPLYYDFSYFRDTHISASTWWNFMKSSTQSTHEKTLDRLIDICTTEKVLLHSFADYLK